MEPVSNTHTNELAAVH